MPWGIMHTRYIGGESGLAYGGYLLFFSYFVRSVEGHPQKHPLF